MNVMLFSRIYAKTGVGNHIKELAEQLVEQGNKVIVVSGTKDNELVSSIPFIQIPTRTHNPLIFLKNIKEIHRIVKANNIDVVHCHHRMAGLYMKVYNYFYKTPVVYTLHSSVVPSDFWHRKMTYYGKMAIAVSTEVKNFLLKNLKLPAKKIITIYNGVNEKKFKPLTDLQKQKLKKEYDIIDKKVIVVMPSRIDSIKNQMLVVEAVGKILEDKRKQLVVVCGGERTGNYYNMLLEKIEQYGLQDNFRFVGWCDSRDILGIADIMLAPSLKEGFPLNVVEAFLMKVPVARSKTGGFDDQKYCFPISSSQSEDMVKILTDLCEGRIEKYRVNVDKAHNYALENFTLKKMTENTLEVYKKVCSKNGKQH